VRAASPSNRWTGTQHGYCNDAAEPLINQLQVTVAPDERTPLQVAIMRMVLKDDFAELPLYWQVTPYVFAKGLTGIGHLSPGAFGNTQSPWNAHLWDRS
jgi:ABC-type transport system substrate-binding protein